MQAKQKAIQPKNAGREALLAWLAAAVNNCQLRASRGEGKHVIDHFLLRETGSEGFPVGLTALCLKFSQWLQKDGLTRHLGLLLPSFYVQNPFRSGAPSLDV